MPNLSIDSNSKWDGLTISPKTTAQTLELSTANTYVDRNIKIGIAAVSADTAKSVLGNAAGKVTLTAGSGTLGGTNITYSTSNTSGITATAKGSVTAAGSITTAGWAPTTMTFSGDTSKSSNTTTKYVTGVTLVAPSSGVNSFTLTIPNGTDNVMTLTFKVDSNSNVWVE